MAGPAEVTGGFVRRARHDRLSRRAGDDTGRVTCDGGTLRFAGIARAVLSLLNLGERSRRRGCRLRDSSLVSIVRPIHTKEDTMGVKGEAFAKELEAKVGEATALLEQLSDADWKKTTATENWTVAATAHHIASSYEPITGIIKALAAGQSLPNFTPQMLDEMNAKHAREFANCSRSETVALLKKGSAAAVALLRGLSDAELAKSGTVFAGMPLMSAEDMVKRAVLGHIDEHFGSIRKAVGR
jgi:uncharacterized damage-inducible protein DinB